MEIEKKFLVNKETLNLELNTYDSKMLEQYYISLNPEVRFRKIVSDKIKYYMTVKSAGTLVREELECEVDSNLYEMMKQCKVGNLIVKKRYNINIKNDLIAELDIYDANLKGLETVEIEFSSIKEANEANNYLPKWFGKEITFEKIFKNKSLSQITFSQIERMIDLK